MTAPWIQRIIAGNARPENLFQTFPWAEKMIGCPHDDLYHAEGDPWVHTGMVAEELEKNDRFRDFSEDRKEILRLGAWMHDIAKPATTEVGFCEKEQRIRVKQPGHAPLGAQMAWQGLIDAGFDPVKARAVHALVFWHQRPSHILSQNNPISRVIRFSHEAPNLNWDDLLVSCTSDNLGRKSPNVAQGVEEMEILRLYIEEKSEACGVDLINGPYPFTSDEARLKFLRNPVDGNEHYTPMNPQGGQVILMSGLPGSGKNTFVKERFGKEHKIIELDAIREELDVSPKDNQGTVIQEAFAQVRASLRKKETIIWNATCLSRLARQKIIGLARDYDASITAISMDVPLNVAMKRNREREHPIPDRVMEKLSFKREPILQDEAHQIFSVNALGEMSPVFQRSDEDIAPAPL